MIIDSLNLFSDEQALTATADSTNIIDLGANRKIGVGEPMSVAICLTVGADDTDTNETYVATLVTSATSNFASSEVIGTATIAAGADAGTKVVIPVAADDRANRYLKVIYTLGGTTPSVTVKTFLTLTSMIQNDTVYASGVTIS